MQPVKDAATNGNAFVIESCDGLINQGNPEVGHDVEDGQLPSEDLVHNPSYLQNISSFLLRRLKFFNMSSSSCFSHYP